MAFKKILSVAFLVFIGKASALCDKNNRYNGYKCCYKSNMCDIVFIDDEGYWNIENGDWCFIDPDKW